MENLDKYQRLNLINQNEILRDMANLRGEDDLAELYNQNIKILKNGYVREYDILFEMASEELAKEECDFVWDILDIYSIIHFSYEKIKNPKLSKAKIKFDGFDGNYEANYRAYCLFILRDLGRYGELQEDEKADFNSHTRRYEKYKAMRQLWIAMNKPDHLSEKEIEELLAR